MNITRASRRQKAEDAEAYYNREAGAAYKKHGSPLGGYAGSLFAKPAGQARLASRSSFYKENDARLASIAVATGNEFAQSYMPFVTDITAKDDVRYDAFEAAQFEYQTQFAKGYIDAETNIANQRAYAENALASVLRKHMLVGKGGDNWNPSGVVDEFLAGTLGDNVAAQLATLVKPEDLIKITDAAMDQAVSMETEIRKASTAFDKAAKKENKKLFAQIFSGQKGAEGLAEVTDAYNKLVADRGFESLADRENAEKMLGYLGHPDFQSEEVSADSFRTSKQGSSRRALSGLEALHAKRLLTHDAVNSRADQLTESAFKSWHAKVDQEHSEEFTQMKDAMDTAFDFIKNQDVGDDFEKKETMFAYTTALRILEEYERDNPGATSMQIRAKAKEAIEEGKKSLTAAAQLKWAQDMTAPIFGSVITMRSVVAPIPGKPGATADQRIGYLISQLKPTEDMKKSEALVQKQKLRWFHRWGVDTTRGLP